MRQRSSVVQGLSSLHAAWLGTCKQPSVPQRSSVHGNSSVHFKCCGRCSQPFAPQLSSVQATPSSQRATLQSGVFTATRSSQPNKLRQNAAIKTCDLRRTAKQTLARRDKRHHLPAYTAAQATAMQNYSHSTVAGGLELMSYTTRLIPRTSLMIRLLMRPSIALGMSAQSAVMPSVLCTARTTAVAS